MWFQTSTFQLTLLSAWNAFQHRPHTFTHLSSLKSQTDLSLKLFVITMPLPQIELTFSFFLFPLFPGQTISTALLSRWSHLSGTMPAWLFPQHKHNSLTSTYYPPWVSAVVKCCRSRKGKYNHLCPHHLWSWNKTFQFQSSPKIYSEANIVLANLM